MKQRRDAISKCAMAVPQIEMHATCHKPHANRRLKCAPSTHTHTHTASMRRKNAQTVSMQLNDWRAHLPTPPPPPTSARRGAKPLESFLRLLLEPSYYYCSCCCDRRRRRRRRAICYTLFSLDAFPFSGIFLNIYYSERPECWLETGPCGNTILNIGERRGWKL